MKIPTKKWKLLPIAAAIVPALLMTGCAASGGSGSSASGSAAASGGAQLAMKDLCGTKPIKVAQIDGFGGNSWRKTTRAELADELSACSNVKIDYTNADGDLQKYITAVNSYTAQGYTAIITYDDFGSQALGALSAASAAGVIVVPYISNPGGKIGTDYAAYAQYDFADEGDIMAKWMNGQLKSGGKVLMTGGLAGGSPSTVALLDGVKATMKSTSSTWTLLSNDPVPSGWDSSSMQKAMAGVLTQYGTFQGWISDYGAADMGGLRALVNAGKQIPPLATSATDNSLGCFWLANKDANPQFQLLTVDGTTRVVRTAALKAMAIINGKPDNYPSNVKLVPFIDTAAGKLPTCNKDLPADADLSSGLSPEKLAAVFK